MALPPRLPKKAKRATRWRSQAHCAFIRSHACSVCNAPNAYIKVDGEHLCGDCFDAREAAANEDDGQPSEQQEWADYDKDC